ncbi:heat stress transcription factor B-1-like [Impatiens glandulifera]|uniref:heat stress transcription factor B-1-like n=1 Tax=Impatiens glandulifera TaxID=253017 RepID=UPI001FB0C767|nr:heat stress transcription factor B-1-like [Impatiens glandulifera]
MDMSKKPRARARATPPAFVAKTYMIVSDHTTDEVVSWNKDGLSFIVWNTTEFAQKILPKYFKHNNFANFTNQLNNYGFKKIRNDRCEFMNDLFQKEKHRRLYDIQRNQKNSMMNFSVSHPTVVDLQTAKGSSSVEEQDNSQENEKLKKHINDLNTEPKDFNNSVVVGSSLKPISSTMLSENYQVGETSNTIPMKIDDEPNTKLFGIYIGGKKAKKNEDEETSTHYEEHFGELKLYRRAGKKKCYPFHKIVGGYAW